MGKLAVFGRVKLEALFSHVTEEKLYSDNSIFTHAPLYGKAVI
jgi:hypothetical protein